MLGYAVHVHSPADRRSARDEVGVSHRLCPRWPVPTPIIRGVHGRRQAMGCLGDCMAPSLQWAWSWSVWQRRRRRMTAVRGAHRSVPSSSLLDPLSSSYRACVAVVCVQRVCVLVCVVCVSAAWIPWWPPCSALVSAWAPLRTLCPTPPLPSSCCTRPPSSCPPQPSWPSP